jgi:undecaprenyl-diphosphatase
MEHAYFNLLHVFSSHPASALAVVLLAAFLESVAFIGTFIPGSSVMFLAGALVGTGSLNLGWVFACAIAGAVAGDAASYWFGSRYRETITRMWPFRTHPGVLAAGQRYFEAHGAKSVVLARFAPPLRAIVPVVAGTLGMAPGRFLVINIVSALIWAPVHILPGVAVGASIELAGAVSFRLVVIIAVLVAAAWLTYNIVRIAAYHARSWTNSSRRALLRWADRHHGAAGREILRVLNPENSPAGLLVTISLFVIVSASVFLAMARSVARGDPLVQVDMSVQRFLQSFRSAWADDVFSACATLGSVPMLAALVVMIVLWMTLERRWRAVVYWLVAVVFSQLLILAMQLAARHAPLAWISSSLHAFPSNRIAAVVVIYGFLAVVIARRVGMVSQILVAVATVAIITVTAVSGLYFGRFTFSDAMGGAALAALWVFLVALTVVWRHPERPPARPFMPLAFLAMIGAGVAVQLGTLPQDRVAANARAAAVTVITPAQWTDSVWRTFSCYRSSMEGDRREPIVVQWTASAEQVETQLRSLGWIEGTRLGARSLLTLVSPNAVATALPVLPRLNNGEPSALVFTRLHASADERDVLRFWPTRYAVEHRNGAPPTPIWLGSLVHERLRRPSWPFNVLRPTREVDSLISERGDGSPWREIEVARSASCEGVRVTLIASRGR